MAERSEHIEVSLMEKIADKIHFDHSSSSSSDSNSELKPMAALVFGSYSGEKSRFTMFWVEENAFDSLCIHMDLGVGGIQMSTIMKWIYAAIVVFSRKGLFIGLAEYDPFYACKSIATCLNQCLVPTFPKASGIGTSSILGNQGIGNLC